MSFYTAMENAMARMVFCLNENLLAKNDGLAGLIDGKDNIKASVDDVLWADNRSDLICQLNDIERKRAEEGRKFFMFAMSPSFALKEEYEMENDGWSSCDIYCYENDETSGILSCRLRIMKLEIAFIHHDGQALIREFHLYTIQTMKAWPYVLKQTQNESVPFGIGKIPNFAEPSSEVYLRAEKTVNLLWDRLLRNIEDLFEKKDGDDGLKNIFDSGNSKRPVLGLTSSPLVSVRTDTTIDVVSPVQIFNLCTEAPNVQTVQRAFYYIKYHMALIDQVWKIEDSKVFYLFALPDIAYIPGKRYDKISYDLIPWTLYYADTPYMYMDDVYAIENILNTWLYGGRRAQLLNFYENHMKNDSFIPEMTMKSFGEKSPVHKGEAAILKKLSELESHYIPGMFSFHMATTPVIIFSKDGKSARGTWFDHSATNLGRKKGDHGNISYMVFVGRYMHEFKKIGNKWYMTRFFGEPLLGMDDWEYDPMNTDGWVVSHQERDYPQPFASLEK